MAAITICSDFEAPQNKVWHCFHCSPESWTVKKAEGRKIDAFELWCWRRLLRVPWTARRSSQSILKEISPGCSLEGLMLKLKLQYFGHFMWRVDSSWSWEGLGAGGEGDNRGWDGWMASPTKWTWVWVNSGSWWWTGKPGVLQFMASQRVRHDWATELNWTESYHRHFDSPLLLLPPLGKGAVSTGLSSFQGLLFIAPRSIPFLNQSPGILHYFSPASKQRQNKWGREPWARVAAVVHGPKVNLTTQT